jgi:hypothetical protein
MAGVRGKSGPPKNLNHCKRPWDVFWRRRALRPQDKWIGGVLGRYASDLAADKPDLTAGEERMIQIAQTARGATMLILAEAAQRGFIAPGKNGAAWDVAPGAKELAKFLQVERQALLGLGLGRRAKEIEGDDLVGRVRMMAKRQEAEWQQEREADGDG